MVFVTTAPLVDKFIYWFAFSISMRGDNNSYVMRVLYNHKYQSYGGMYRIPVRSLYLLLSIIIPVIIPVWITPLLPKSISIRV